MEGLQTPLFAEGDEMPEKDHAKLSNETCAIVAGSLAGGLAASRVGLNEDQAIALFYTINRKLLQDQHPVRSPGPQTAPTPLPAFGSKE